MRRAEICTLLVTVDDGGHASRVDQRAQYTCGQRSDDVVLLVPEEPEAKVVEGVAAPFASGDRRLPPSGWVDFLSGDEHDVERIGTRVGRPEERGH